MRVDLRFLEQLDVQLGEERGLNGAPSRIDFLRFELPAIEWPSGAPREVMEVAGETGQPCPQLDEGIVWCGVGGCGGLRGRVLVTTGGR